MKTNLIKLLQLPSKALEYSGDHYTRRSQEIEKDDIYEVNPFVPLISEAYRVFGGILEYLAHPFGGKRVTRANVPDLSYER